MKQELSERKNKTQLKQKAKTSYPKRQIWQGREDADMLQEKQNKWHCKPNSNDDFEDED